MEAMEKGRMAELMKNREAFAQLAQSSDAQRLMALLKQQSGGVQEAAVVLPGDLPPLIPEGPPLEAEEFDPAVLPAQKPQEAVEGGEHGVDGSGSAAAGQKRVPPGGGVFPGQGPAVQPAGEGSDVPEVFFDGARAPLLASQVGGEGLAVGFGDGHGCSSFCDTL